MQASPVTELLERDGGGGFGQSGPLGGGEGSGNPGVPQRAYVTGMILALGGILMFFMALVSAWVVRKGFPNSDWQPITPPRILWLNSLILIVSSVTLSRSRRCLVARRDEQSRHWWGITTILGVFFLAGQLLAWRQLAVAGLFLATNPSSSFFYVFTSAHGLHILGGIAALLVVAVRPPQRLTRQTATTVVAMYWHFLCVLWLGIFALLWLGK
ncbi:MAG TPA: heme-copper oxidase subunit III [Candidatus Acidoferrales bacterium]|nr:heme-copper oxidase subunit III [Candidatus Acidoferrales bacterium]